MKRKIVAMMIAGTLTVSMAAGSVSVFAESAQSAAEESAAESAQSPAEESTAASSESLAEAGAEDEAMGASEEGAGEAQESSILGALIGSISEAIDNKGEGESLIGSLLGSLGSDEEGGLIESLGTLISEGKGLAETAAGLLGGGDMNELVTGISDLLKGADLDGITEKVSGIIGMFSGETGDQGETDAESVVGALFGTEDKDFDFSAVLREQLDSPEINEDPTDEAITDFICERNLNNYDPTDVQIVAPVLVGIKQVGDKEYAILGDFWQFNFNVDGDRLVFMSGGNDPGLIYVNVNGDEGTCEITDSKFYLDEEFDEHLDELAEAVDMTAEEYYDADREASPVLYAEIIKCAKILPEITSFQVNDDVYTIDQAKDYVVDYYVNALKELQAAAEETTGEIDMSLEEAESVISSAADEAESAAEEFAEELESSAESAVGELLETVSEAADESTAA